MLKIAELKRMLEIVGGQELELINTLLGEAIRLQSMVGDGRVHFMTRRRHEVVETEMEVRRRMARLRPDAHPEESNRED